jgi:hypothetical protein
LVSDEQCPSPLQLHKWTLKIHATSTF